MEKGWYIGNFPKAIFQTDKFEVTCKDLKKGEVSEKHFHKIATEINLIISGKISANKKEFSEGDIIIIEPKEEVETIAIMDSKILTIKVPSVSNDKYYIK